MVDGREGASEDTHQRGTSTDRDDGKENVGDGRPRLSIATGAEDTCSADVVLMGGAR